MIFFSIGFKQVLYKLKKFHPPTHPPTSHAPTHCKHRSLGTGRVEAKGAVLRGAEMARSSLREPPFFSVDVGRGSKKINFSS